MATLKASDFFGGTIPPPPEETAIHTPDTSPGIFERIAADFQQRHANVDASKARGDSKASTLLQGAGNAAGFLGDVVAEGVKSITPQPVKDAAKSVVTKIASTPENQQRLAQFDAWKTAHPEAAANLSSIVDIASLIPVGKGAQIAAKGAEAAAMATKTGAKAAAGAAAPLMKAAGEKATGLAVTMEVPTRQAVQAYEAAQPTLIDRVKGVFSKTATEANTAAKPTSEANTAVRLLQPGTEWQLGVHAKKVSQSLWTDTIAPSLAGTKDKIDIRSFFGDLKKQIIKDNADLSRRSTLLNALESFQQDFSKVGKVSYDKLQSYKEGWAKFVPEKAYKGEAIAGALNEVRNLAAQNARKAIYEKLGPAVKQAYLDYGNLQSIAEAGIKSVDALRSKGVTKQVWEFVMDKAVTPIATVAGKVLYKTGEGLEFLGNSGAKKVRDIIQTR